MSRHVIDEFSARSDLSPQEKYQLRHERDGLCRLCPKEAFALGKYCVRHLKAQRAYSHTDDKKKRRNRKTDLVPRVNPQDLI